MSVDAWRQRRRHRFAVRGPPAFPKKVGDVRADRQILHEEARIAFEARAGGRIGLELALLVDRQFRTYAAASTLLAERLLRLGFARFLHTARLDVRLVVRPSRPALQPRDFVAQRRDCSLRLRQLLEKLQHQTFQIGGRKRVEIRRRRHSPIDSEKCRFEHPSQQKNKPGIVLRQGFCPSYVKNSVAKWARYSMPRR